MKIYESPEQCIEKSVVVVKSRDQYINFISPFQAANPELEIMFDNNNEMQEYRLPIFQLVDMVCKGHEAIVSNTDLFTIDGILEDYINQVKDTFTTVPDEVAQNIEDYKEFRAKIKHKVDIYKKENQQDKSGLNSLFGTREKKPVQTKEYKESRDALDFFK